MPMNKPLGSAEDNLHPENLVISKENFSML